jgi:hypothetical protein
MRQGPGPGQEALDDGRFAPRAVVGTARPTPAGRDEQLGQIFQNMRLSMKASREAVARRLAITTATVDTFEAGAIAAFPHGKETTRIVRAYCELLRLDPEPILWRIRTQLQALADSAKAARSATQRPSAKAAGAAWAGPRSSTPTAQAEAEQPAPRRRRRRGRALFALSAPIALAAVVVYLAQLVPQPVYRAIALLPGSIERPVRAGLDYLMLATAPRREGLKWVDVGDPQVRKADKLQPDAR